MFESELVLDATDLYILRKMQENGRISNAELAREMGMAPSAMLERVKKLEHRQVIMQYTARVNPQALQQKLLAFISLRSAEGYGSSTTGKLLADIPEVQEVHHIAGDDCYLVKVRTTDSAALMHLMRSRFSQIPNLLSSKTTIVLETVKEHQQLCIPQTEQHEPAQ